MSNDRSERNEETISVAELRRAIRRLPADPPVVSPRVWYRTQKQHWLGWLAQYDGPGAYGRIPDQGRNARFAYNHIVCPEMLLWLAKAAGVDPERVQAAREAAEAAGSKLPARAGAIRRCVPWSEVYRVLWGEGSDVSRETLRSKLARRLRR